MKKIYNYYLRSSSTLRCFGQVMMVISSCLVIEYFPQHKLFQAVHSMTSAILKVSCKAERFPKIVWSETTKVAAWYISPICPAINVLYPFMAALVHKFDVKAIALEGLVSQDGHILRKFQLLILIYWHWWLFIQILYTQGYFLHNS